MIVPDVFLKALRKDRDKDWVDRLHTYWTPLALIITSISLTTKQMVGQPIQCWLPAHFASSWEEYIESVCFTQNTFFSNLSTPVRFLNEEQRKKSELAYYQWIPFFLIFQSILFILPFKLWSFMSSKAEFPLKEICKNFLNIKTSRQLRNLENGYNKNKSERAQLVAEQIHEYLTIRPRLMRSSNSSSYCFNGIFMSQVYLVSKLLCLLQTFLQLFILNHFLSPSYTFWGLGILIDIINGREWMESGHFPRVSFCDIIVQQPLGDPVHYRMQCALVINNFNEKVYIFMWFWFVYLLIVTLYNFLDWYKKLAFTSSRKRYIKSFLEMDKIINTNHATENYIMTKFIENYLNADGILLSYLMEKSSGSIFFHEVILHLWCRFLNDESNECDDIA